MNSTDSAKTQWGRLLQQKEYSIVFDNYKYRRLEYKYIIPEHFLYLIVVQILKKYTILRKFIKNLNRAMGILICACVSVSLPYYAAWIGMSIFESNVHIITLIRVYAFFLIFFLALSLAADINKKVLTIHSYCLHIVRCFI